MKKKIFSVLFALVLVLSLSLVTAAPVAAQSGTFTVTSGTYTTVKVDDNNGNIGATLTGTWSGAVTGDFVAVGTGSMYATGHHEESGYGTTVTVEVSGTMSVTGITFSGTAVRISYDNITEDAFDSITGTVVITDGAIDVVLVGWDEAHTYTVDILMSGEMVLGSSTVGVAANTLPSIVAISVTPTDIDFGTLYPGQSSGPEGITIDNIGTVTVDVTALLDPATGTVFDYLELADVSPPSSWGPTELVASIQVNAVLVVPPDYSAQGEETATLIFIATPTS